MPRKKTNEEFIEELKLKNPTIEDLEEYINVDTKIKFKCKTCGNIWEVRPSDLLRKNKTGCPQCSIKIRSKKTCNHI